MAKGFILEDVSEYLGWKESTVNNLITVKELKGVKIDGKWLFSKSLIDEWIEDFVKRFKWETIEEKTLIKEIKKGRGLMSEEKMEKLFDD